MTDFWIHEVDVEDDDSLQRYLDAVMVLDERQRGLDVEGTRRMQALVGEHLSLLAFVGNVPVAYAEASGAYNDPAASRLPFGVVVHPDHRGGGIGSALFARLGEWARLQRDEPSWMLAVPEADDYSMDFWARRGFEVVDRYPIVSLDLSARALVIERAVVDGIRIVSLEQRSDLLHAAWECIVAAFVDMPGEAQQPTPFEPWSEAYGTGHKPPAGTFLALDEAEAVVGVTTTVVTPGSMDLAHNGFTGVAAAARGRGVAWALKLQQVQWCREAGYRELQTTNHEHNTAMRAINERLGYQPKPVQVILHGPLAPA